MALAWNPTKISSDVCRNFLVALVVDKKRFFSTSLLQGDEEVRRVSFLPSEVVKEFSSIVLQFMLVYNYQLQ